MCPVLEKGKGGAIPDPGCLSDARDGRRVWLNVVWYPEDPPITITFLPASLSFELTISTVLIDGMER